MQTIKSTTNQITTTLTQAGVFLLGLMAPAAVFAQETNLNTGANAARPDGASGNLLAQGGIFAKVSNILIILIGAVSVIMLIIGGFKYVLSGGDSSSVEGAKNTILYALIGIVVAFLAYAAVNFVIGQLGGESTPTLPANEN